MRLSNRLQIGQYWGTNKPGMSFALTGPAMIKDAIKRNNVVDIFSYRSGAFGKEPDADSIDTHPLGLAHKRVFDTTDNTLANWTDNLHGTEYLDQLEAVDGSGVHWLAHTSQEQGSYVSNVGQYAIPENTSFCARFVLFDVKRTADDEVALDYFSLAWGIAGTGSQWQFVMTNRETAIMRLSASWTQEQEDTLYTLLSIVTPTDQQQLDIVQLKNTLYHDYQTFSINGTTSKKADGQTLYELTFIPERIGKVSIYQGDEFVAEVVDSSILKTRSTGTLWGETRFQLRRNAGHFYWQVGYPEFATTGSLTFPYDVSPYPRTAVQYQMIYDAPTGTTVEFTDTQPEGSNKWAYLNLILTTTNNRITPMLYAAHAYIPAGLRGSVDPVWFDTNLVAESPVMNVQTQFDGPERRGQHSLEIRDVNGGSFSSVQADTKFHYDNCENRVANLWVGGAQLMSQGIVKRATAKEMAEATAGETRADVTKPYTGVDMVLCDQWAILEEYQLFEGELVGDGLALGVFVKRALRCVGIGASGEIAGIANGPTLPTAAPGEKWAVMCGSCTLADFLIQIIEKYGLGMQLWIGGDGVWNLAYRSTNVVSIGGSPANFTSSATLNTDATYPGRLAMHVPLDLERSTEEFFNVIPVVGASDSNARRDISTTVPDAPISGVWVQQDSITYTGSGVRSKRFIGRAKVMSPVVDTGLRTRSAINGVGRSLAMKYCKPPMYIGFNTFYHYPLFVGDIITCDGVKCEVWRISGADVNADRMYILARVYLSWQE